MLLRIATIDKIDNYSPVLSLIYTPFCFPSRTARVGSAEKRPGGLQAPGRSYHFALAQRLAGGLAAQLKGSPVPFVELLREIALESRHPLLLGERQMFAQYPQEGYVDGLLG